MNVFLREVRAYRKSTIIWTVSLSTIVVLFMALYPAFTNDVDGREGSLQRVPRGR